MFFNAESRLRIEWVRRDADSCLSRMFPSDSFAPSKNRFQHRITEAIDRTTALGPQPLWKAYESLNGEQYGKQRPPFRTANQVSTGRQVGNTMTYLVRELRPEVIVEFGTAFGASGMYWLAGLEEVLTGHLFTFEPNHIWADLARKNLSAISSRYTLTVGTFEEYAERILNGRMIDIAFIDAIHTSEFVWPQLTLVLQRLKPGGVVLLDDVSFSSDMTSCWRKVAKDSRVRASALIAGRVGIIEVSTGECFGRRP